MTIYLIQAFVIVFAGAVFHPNRSDKRRRDYLVFVFLLLTIVSGIRAVSVGADTWNYVWMFNHVDTITSTYTRIEPGFILYMRILHLLSSDPRILLFSSSIICIGIACAFTYKFSKDPVMSMILYLLMGSYFAQMNVMRQALALSFTEVAFMIVLSNSGGVRRKIISALFVLFATSMHGIAIVAFIPYALVVRNNNYETEETSLTVDKALLRALGLAAIAFAGYSLVMRLITMVFPRYAHYFTGTWSDANYSASLLNTLIAFVFAIVGAVSFRNKKLSNIQRFAAIMLGFSIVFNVLSMRMEIWSRVARMFGIYTYLLWVPEFTSEIYSIKNRWILNSSIVLFALAHMLVILLLRPEWTKVVPYIIG